MQIVHGVSFHFIDSGCEAKESQKSELKGTRRLGSDELVYKKPSVTVCYKMHMVRKMFLK